MKLKQILSAAAAAAIAVSAFSVQASAAQKKFSLLTMPWNELCENGISSLGDGLYCTFDESSHINGFISITDDDLTNWRENGKLTWTEVKADGIDFSKHVDISGRVAIYLDDSNNATDYLAYTFNGKDEVTVTYESDNWLCVRDDGNIIEACEKDNSLSVSVISPEGDKNTAVFALDNVEGYWKVYPIKNGRDMAWVTHLDAIKACNDENYSYYDMVVSLDLVDSNGTVKHIDSIASEGFKDYGGGIIENTPSIIKGSELYIYDPETAQPSSLNYALEKSAGGISYSLLNIVDGKQDVAVGGYYGSSSSGETYATALIDLNDDGKIVSDFYTYIDLSGNDIFLVITLDGKCGYINNDGELLKTFDDASVFDGDYAPVVKDGKAFLVNKSFNRVSEKIKADGVVTFGNELYLIKLNGENYIATFAANEPAETDTPDTADVTPEAPDASNTETPADNGAVKGSPDTGAAAVGVTAAAFVSAAGVLLLARKRK